MQMPRVYIRFGRETGAIDIETDLDQFSDPHELKRWAEMVHRHIAEQVLIAPGEKIEVRQAAARVQIVINRLVKEQVRACVLRLEDGRWRYGGA